MICKTCSGQIDTVVKFCPHCGTSVYAATSKLQEERNFERKLWAIGVYYFAQVLICLIAGFTDTFDIYPDKLFLEVPMILLTLGFFVANYKNLVPLFFLKKVRIRMILTIIPITIIASILVSYTVDWLNEKIFHTYFSYLTEFYGVEHQYLWLIVMTAFVPAIEEELGFRGILYSQLKSFMSPPQIVWVTAILFTTIHFSVISAFWMIGFAWILGYLRSRYQTLWYGIVIHFFFNATAVTIDYLAVI